MNMREIKFRAFIKHLNCIADVISIDFSKKEVEVYLPDRDEIRFYFFNDVELLQFTGYKDRNGDEIYEGHIVKVTWRYDSDIGTVKYIRNGFFVGDMKRHTPISLGSISATYEVIGNVYENPELLKE